jgi:hypothetical protein
MKYLAKVLSEIDNGPNYWKYLKVGVFKIENDTEEQIGEYQRNYSSLYQTFHHFQKDGRDFALYSPDYTVTRLMELPSCRDIGGESPGADGFCPVEYLIPTYIEHETAWETVSARGRIGGDVSSRRINNPAEEDLIETVESREFQYQGTGELCKIKTARRPLSPLFYYPFGFVAGCLWGDDSSWKIQYLDLSEAEKGVIKREERFGYIELPNNIDLRAAVSMYGYGKDEESYSNYIRINHVQTFDLRNGKVVDPFEA